jgi:hypothetical protein
MDSEGTVTIYVNGVGRFVKYIRFNDPETALQAMLKGDVDIQTKVDSFIFKMKFFGLHKMAWRLFLMYNDQLSLDI